MLYNQQAEMCVFVCICVRVETDRARLRMISREQMEDRWIDRGLVQKFYTVLKFKKNSCSNSTLLFRSDLKLERATQRVECVRCGHFCIK